MEHLPLAILLLVFLAAAVAVWIAGIYLSSTTDTLSTRLHLGEALGGLILLAFATNLPEIAITWTAARSGNLGIAVGNILGGVAIQTVVLVLIDIFGVKKKEPLTYQAASLGLVLEGVLVIAVLVVAMMGSQLPPVKIWHVGPASLLILVLWMVGLLLIGKAKNLPWKPIEQAPDKHRNKTDKAPTQAMATGKAALIFAAGALVTLLAGIVLEQSGDALASHFGISGVLFGGTVLAAATSLPEVSTGLASVKIGDYDLAFSDIFGGNAFLPVLFLLASLVSGETVLPRAQKSDVYLAGLGILLTAVYLYGLVFRPQRRVLKMGIDSLIVLVLYALGVFGLVAISRASG